MRGIILLLLLIPLVSALVSGAQQWYITVNPSQVQLIVGLTNSSYIITLLQNADKAVYAEVYELTDHQVAQALESLAERGFKYT